MSFRTGSHVSIQPLSKEGPEHSRSGRVVGSQQSGHSDVMIYLVRYEVGEGRNARSETALYFEDELT